MDEIKKLYDALSKRGYYTKSFDDFKVQFQDKAYQDKVFGVVSRDGLYTKSKDEFLSKYSVVPQQNTSKKKEVSEPALPTGGKVGISEVPSEEGGAISKAISKGIETALQQPIATALQQPKVKQAIEGKQREDVLSFLQQEQAKTPTKITGPTPTIPTKGVILPVKSLKKVETSFALTKEKIDNIVVPTFQEVASSADPLGAIEQKESEEKDLQRKADLMAVSTLVKEQIPNFYQAFKAAQSPLPDTRTNQLTKERAANYESATRGLREIKAPDLMTANNLFIESNIIPQIERAAVMYHINKYPSFQEELDAVNTSVDNPNLPNALGSAKMGQIMQEFLYSPEVVAFENQEDSNIGAAIQRAREVNLSRNTMWGVSVVGNKVSQAFERSPYRRNAIAGFDTPALRSDLNTVATQVLTPEEYKIYDLYVKGNEDKYLDVPSFFERFARGGEGVFNGVYNTLSKITGYGKSTEEIVRENWEKEALNVTADPEGLRNFLAESGNVVGLVAALGATGRVATPIIGSAAAGTGLPAATTTSIADAVNVSTAFLGDMLDQGTVKYPDDPVKAYTSGIFNTAAFVAMGRSIFPLKNVQSVFNKAKPEIDQVVRNLTNGSITREAAKKELNTIVKKGVDVLGAGLVQNVKVSAELTALQGANEILDIALGMDPDKLKKLYPEGTYGESFKHLFLSNALVSTAAGYGKVKQKNTIARESVYEAASNPKRYSNIIEQSAVKDPTLNKQELLDNLAFSVEVKRLLDQRGVPVEKQKDYLILALGERVALAEKAKIQDSTLRKEVENKISEAQKEKEAILTEPEEVAAEEPVAPELPAAEELTYRVDYFDPETNKMASKMFATEKEGSAFQRGLTSEQNKYGSKGYYTSVKGVGEVAAEAGPEVPENRIPVKREVYRLTNEDGDIVDYKVTTNLDGTARNWEMRGEGEKEFGDTKVKFKKVQDFIDVFGKDNKIEKIQEEGYEKVINPKLFERLTEEQKERIKAAQAVKPEAAPEIPAPVTELPATPETQKKSIENIIKQEELDISPDQLDRLYDEAVKGGGKIEESQVRKILNVGYLRASRIAEEINGLGVREVTTPKAAPEVPAAPVEEMEDMPELGEVRPETPRTEPPAFEGYKPIEFAEAFEVEEKPKAKEVKAETDIRKRALNLDVEGVPRGEVLQYFIGGGKISSDAIKKLFQRSENRIRWNVMKPEERKSRIGLTSKKGPTIEELAEKLAGADRLDMTQEFRNIIEEVVLENYGTKSMERELVESYDAEYKMMMREQELMELGEEMERQIQEFTAGLPEAQKREIAEVLNEIRNNDGTIDWDTIEREMQSAELSSSPIIQKLSPETQKIIIDGIKQLNETGRVSRVPVEAVPSAEARRAGDFLRKAADATRKGKISKLGGFRAGTGYDAVWDASLEVIAKALEGGATVVDAIDQGLKYVKSTGWYKKLSDPKDFDKKYREHLKSQYDALQVEAAGEVPVQPEARVSGKVEAGVPPTEPPKVTPEGESPREEKRLSGIKKALVSKEVLDKVDFERTGDKQLLSAGRQIIESGEVKPRPLVNKIVEEGKGVLTPAEVVALITYKADLDTQVENLTAEIEKMEADGQDIGTKGVELKELELDQQNFDIAAVITAQQQSLSFRLRMWMLDSGYNLQKEISQYKKINNGTIPEDVKKRFEEYDAEIQRLKKKIKDVNAQKLDQEGERAAANIVEDVQREGAILTEKEIEVKVQEGVQKELNKIYEQLPVKKKSKADQAIAALEKIQKRLRNRTYDAALGVPVALIDAGITTIKNAIKAGVAIERAIDLGINKIKDGLKGKPFTNEDRFRKDLLDGFEAEGIRREKEAKDSPSINEDGTLNVPERFLRQLVRDGVTNIEGMTDAVFQELQPQLPELTKRQVRDAITQYGKTVNPTKDDIRQQIGQAKRIGRLISELEDLQKMNSVEFALKYGKKKPQGVKITEAEKNLKKEIKALAKSLKTNEQNLAEAKSAAKRRIEELQRRIKEKDFSSKEKPVIKADAELEMLYSEKKDLENKFVEEKERARLKNRPFTEKMSEIFQEITTGIPRILVAGFDLSATLVQGVRTLFTKPKIAAGGFIEGLRQLGSIERNENFLKRYRSSYNGVVAKNSGLAISDVDGKISAKDQIFVIKWANAIYDAAATVVTLGHKPSAQFIKNINPLKASQRAYDGAVNYIRTKSFDQMMRSLQNDGYTPESNPEQFKAAADFINTTTGRASLGKLESSAQWLSTVFFSPRKLASEFKLYSPLAILYYGKMPAAVRKRALIDFAKFAGSVFITHLLLRTALQSSGEEQDDDFWDPDSSNFLSFKINGKTVSVLGGAKSMIVFMSRHLLGNRYVDQYGVESEFGRRPAKKINTKLDLAKEFMIGKLAPTTGALADYYDQNPDFENDDEILRSLVIPLWLQDANELYKDDPLSMTLMFNFLSVIGANIRKVDVVEVRDKIIFKEKVNGREVKRIVELTDDQKEEFQDIANSKFQLKLKKLSKEINSAKTSSERAEYTKMAADKAKKDAQEIMERKYKAQFRQFPIEDAGEQDKIMERVKKKLQ